MFVKWNDAEGKIIMGPQGAPGGGDNWYPYLESDSVVNARTQTTSYRLDTGLNAVVQEINGEGSLTYDQERIALYKAIGDQLDLIWHDIDNGTLDITGEFYSAIKSVKDAHPKI